MMPGAPWSSTTRLITAAATATTVVMAIVTVFAVYTALQIKIGNPVEGSNLLWPNSEFNQAVREINSHFPGVNTLEVVLEAKDQNDPQRVARQADTVITMLRLQGLMEQGTAPPRATLSFADYLMPLATDFPNVRAYSVALRPSPNNPLGLKGAGEGGIIPVGGVIANAVANALQSFNVQPRRLPLSPAAVWRLVEQGRVPG